MKDETKTIREWLSELPEPISSRAIKNTGVYYNPELEEPALNQFVAISGAFIWSTTPEGHEFWDQVSRGESPELPEHLNEEE